MTATRGRVPLEAAKVAVYERPNSPIFAPFMVHIVCNLLNESRINIEATISHWGGGLKLLKQCYPQWDERIAECCKTTPISHEIWKTFIQRYIHKNWNEINRLNDVRILQELLNIWIKTGVNNNNYGPYPSPFEQEQYQKVAMIPMGYLSEAITDFKFEASFKANKLDIETFISHKNTQNNDANHMMIDDRDDDDKEEKSDAFNPLNDTMPWDYNEIIRKTPIKKSKNSKYNNNFRGYTDNGSRKNKNKKRGTLYYQRVYFTESQCKHIASHFMFNRGCAPYLLFGDNNIDKERAKDSSERIYFGGQAQIVGGYDDFFAFGITTTWKHEQNGSYSYFQGNGYAQIPDIIQFKRLMDAQFLCVYEHIASGADVIVPAATEDDLRQNREKYYDKYGGIKFKHNIGTGIANLNEKYLKYIQFKLDELVQYADRVEWINYEKMYGEKDDNDKKELDLPFDDHKYRELHKKKENTKQRLLFEHEIKEDPFSPLHYHSPSHDRPRVQRHKGRHHTMERMYVNDDGEDGMECKEQERTRREQRLVVNTPINNLQKEVIARIPHYKSPNGYAEDETEWKMYSSPKRIHDIADGDRNTTSSFMRMSNGWIRSSNVLSHVIKCCLSLLSLLFHYPRKLYIALVIQNRPQDVFKIMSIFFILFAAISYITNWGVTTFTLLWIALAVLCAFCGGDQFPKQRHHQRHTFYS